jgi:decaprenylphospho-beta-D-erythro-pentofuranosid-2-ulose 2-reductase
VKTAILGATRGIGRAIARQMVERGDQVFLLGRDDDALERSALDLDGRARGSVAGTAHCDLSEWVGFDGALAAARTALNGLDCVVVTAAAFATQEQLETDPEQTAGVLHCNFTGSIMFGEAARRVLLGEGGGTLCMLSSVAGDRARKPVVLYGATKAGLSYYLDGLDVRYRSAGLRTVCVKPGFVATEMTAGLNPPPFATNPDVVARRVLRAIERGRPVVYVPGIWRVIMLVIRMLPRLISRRLNF